MKLRVPLRLTLALAAAALTAAPLSGIAQPVTAQSSPDASSAQTMQPAYPTPPAEVKSQPAQPTQPPPPATQPTGASAPAGQAGDVGPETYSKDETLQAAEKFFGGTTEGLAKAIEKAFGDLGRPNAYIQGSEGSGAFFVGLRYGEGDLYYKGGGAMKVYWQGPSVGWDFGGNASKVFMLVYNLHWTRDLFQKFPGIDGSLYLVAGVGVNYLRSGQITLAPIRTGVGLRAGASIGYLTFTQHKSWNPF